METVKPQVLSEVEVADLAQSEAPEVTALIEGAKAGDEASFADLMGRYERRIISIGIQMGLSRPDSQDACQEAFIKVFRYIRRFQSGRSFFKWLYRIAIHSIYDQMRRRRSAGNISIEDLSAQQLGSLREEGVPLDRRLEASQLATRLLEGLDQLSRRERTVFVLRDLQGMSTGEIGRILRLSQITVRRHCMGARKRLRDRLFERDH